MGKDKDEDTVYELFPTIISLSDIVNIADLGAHSEGSKSQSVIQARHRQFFLRDPSKELFEIFNWYHSRGYEINQINHANNKSTMDLLRQIAANTSKDNPT